MNKSRHTRLRKLFDIWSLQNVLVISILKVLQIFRDLGAKAESAGWRKVTGIFVRNEYSKFSLAVFRLNYAETIPTSQKEAERILIQKLRAFIRNQPQLNWAIRVGKLYFRRERIFVCDIMKAEMDHFGNLTKITPCFDDSAPPGHFLPQQISFILKHITVVYNTMRYEPSEVRMARMEHALKVWIASSSGYDIKVRMNLTQLVNRIMSAVFLFTEVLPGVSDGTVPARFRMPDLRRVRHPGWGMLCIAARFSGDLSETDLWWQCSHVTSDGAPMQEILNKLKNDWGTAGQLRYPALTGKISTPDISYCGDKIFRAKVYADFSPLSRLRRELNARWSGEMLGSAAIAAMVLWGISRHSFLAEKKFLVPVDLGMRDGERELGLLVIRPGKFRKKGKSPLKSFLEFQKEFNRKLEDIRCGHGESDEFLQLCTMLHPMFYHAAKYLAPDSLQEILGTIGFTTIRDAEMFIGPFTDFQSNGFLSLGNAAIPTVNGKTAGAICICGHKKLIRKHLEAISLFINDPEKAFQENP